MFCVLLGFGSCGSRDFSAFILLVFLEGGFCGGTWFLCLMLLLFLLLLSGVFEVFVVVVL